MPKWMAVALEGIDLEKTGALFGAIIAGGVILRAVFRALWEKLVYSAMQERCDRYDKAAELTKANRDRLEALESAIIAQGTVLRDMPRLITTTDNLCTSVDKLTGVMEKMDTHIEDLQNWRTFTEGRWAGEDRRERQDHPHPKRRRDDA